VKFYTKKRRAPVITIIPLIDILCILLIFFIVTTTFRKENNLLKINLPESQEAKAAATEKEPPLLLRVQNEQNLTLDDKPVTVGDLAAALKDALAKHPQRGVALQADKEASFGLIVKVLDALQAAGVKNIPAFTDPKKP